MKKTIVKIGGMKTEIITKKPLLISLKGGNNDEPRRIKIEKSTAH